jgi:hypothetical protein
MTRRDQCKIHLPDGISLRQELSLRAMRLAAANGSLHQRTDGTIPSILFGRDERGRHGNFHPDSYLQIQSSESWLKRLGKTHTAYKRRRARADWEWKELDCSNSSDALLMNIFCYPGIMADRSIRSIFNAEWNTQPEFGFKARIPLRNGKQDATEIDLKAGELLVEAKLTETNFQWATPTLLARYRDLDTVFDLRALPTKNAKYGGYQLIRGTLAAYALECSFCVLCDARRPDLIEIWFQVLRAVHSAELRCRLKLLTWQELASKLPSKLQTFLLDKYGIRATA